MSIYNLASVAGRDPADHRLFCDKITNMVWGVEERIPGILGNGTDGFEAATALYNYFLHRTPPTTIPQQANEAKIRYVLGTSVPANWTNRLPSNCSPFDLSKRRLASA